MKQGLPSIPDHELFGVIGRGAFGEVWLGRNVMGIWRAVKVIRRLDFLCPESYEREFEAIRRYEPVARSTEGLVQVLHVGRNDPEGYFYYIMELADDSRALEPLDPARAHLLGVAARGTGLSGVPTNLHYCTPSSGWEPGTYTPRTLRSELARRGRLELKEVLAIASALTRGLAQLHGAGLVHRDIKPANVIFVQGFARLADMGLVDRQGHLSLVGTEGYVAPEGTGTPAADLYSLGLVIYEMATGCDRKQFPQLPSDWLAARDPNQWELHEVILRACEGMPERRYQSAAELKADLAMISSGQSVRERRALARRSRRLKALGAVATLGFLIALGWALLSKQRAAIENHARVQAERHRAETELALVESHLAQAAANRQTGRTGQRYQALARISEALARLRSLATNSGIVLSSARQAGLIAAARDETIAALTRVDLRELGRFPAGFDRQWGLPMDAELRRLAVAGPSNTVSILALPDGLPQARLPSGPAEAEWLGPFSPDGRHLMVRYKNRENWVWNLETGRPVFRQEATSPHVRAVFWREGVLVPESPEELVWYSLADPSERRSYPSREQLMWLVPVVDGEEAIGFTPWFRAICRLSGDQLIERGRRALPGGFNMGEFAISRDGRFLAITLGIGETPVVDLDRPDAAPTRLTGHAAEVVAAAFHPDGRHLATSSWDGTTRIWDWKAGESRLLHDEWTSMLRFSADGTRCAMAVGDRAWKGVILHEVATPRFLRTWRLTPPMDGKPIRKVTPRADFSADGRLLALSTGYGVQLLRVPDLELQSTLGTNEFYAVRFAPDGRRLFAAGADGQWIWELLPPNPGSSRSLNPGEGTNMIRVASHLPGRQGHFTLGPDGEPVAGFHESRVFRRPGVLPGKWVEMTKPKEQLWFATSRDARWIAISSATRLHQIRLSDQTCVWDMELRGIARFDFSPDGRRLAVLDADGLLCLDVASGEVSWRLPRSDVYMRVGDLAWSLDGRRMAAALQRRDVSLIDAEEGRIAARLTNPTDAAVTGTVFSPNGRYLAVTLVDQSVHLWDLQTLREDLAKLGLDWERD